MRRNIILTLFSFTLLLPIVSGCSQQTLDSARQDTQRNVEAARPSLAKLSLGGRVTAALAAANIRGIRVDAGISGVSLHGTVKTAAEKARAARIAKETLGPEKRVSNQIQVERH